MEKMSWVAILRLFKSELIRPHSYNSGNLRIMLNETSMSKAPIARIGGVVKTMLYLASEHECQTGQHQR